MFFLNKLLCTQNCTTLGPEVVGYGIILTAMLIQTKVLKTIECSVNCTQWRVRMLGSGEESGVGQVGRPDQV